MQCRLLLLSLLALAVSGCQTSRFYAQAISGQWEIVTQRRTFERVSAAPDSSPELIRQLGLIREMCAFAGRQLDLPAQGQFESYVDLRREFVVWNVHAAPEFSTTAKTWWYPVVGRLEYRGYFREKLARNLAKRLNEEGFDVYVGGVDAYSTLGWFNDPVLNTFVDLPEAELAELVFHELAHRRVFIPGDTDFNEAFATAVAREGVRRWLTFRNDAPALDRFQANRPAETAVIKLILAARKQLETLYTEDAARPVNELREAKAKVIEHLRANYHALRERLPHFPDYDAWMTAPINNAKLNTIDTYYQLVPSFEARLLTLNGNLTAFYENIASTRNLTQADRRRGLAQEPGTVVRLR